MPSELQVHSRTAGYAPFHALALRRSEFRARRPPNAGEGKHEDENGRSGSAVPSPQRNVNEIRSVQNTNHAPATTFQKTTLNSASCAISYPGDPLPTLVFGSSYSVPARPVHRPRYADSKHSGVPVLPTLS